jgi:hypothetical protein
MLPAWCSYGGTPILVNTAKHRAKYDNLHSRRSVTELAVDQEYTCH